MKKISAVMFCLICTAFSAAMLVMTLFGRIEIAKYSDMIVQTEKERERLKEENGVLKVRLENSLSLEDIESYASEKLGMRTPGPGQILYIEMG